MGSRMATNLLKNDVAVTVWNRSPEPAIELKKAGATVADSAVAAVQEADLVFSMLSNPAAVEAVFLGETNALAALPKNAIWIDCSTVNPSFTQRMEKAATAAGVRFVDAPVAGTLPHAANAELVFFVGAEQALLDEIEPYLNYMGKKVMRIGETGKGASFKMLVNVMLAQSMVIFSETVLLGEKMGLDKTFLLNVIPNLVVSAPFTKFKAEMIKGGEYDVQFPLELMHKDLHLAATTAYELQQPLYLANVAKELFAEAAKQGMGRLDFAAIHKYLEEK